MNIVDATSVVLFIIVPVLFLVTLFYLSSRIGTRTSWVPRVGRHNAYQRSARGRSDASLSTRASGGADTRLQKQSRVLSETPSPTESTFTGDSTSDSSVPLVRPYAIHGGLPQSRRRTKDLGAAKQKQKHNHLRRVK